MKSLNTLPIDIESCGHSCNVHPYNPVFKSRESLMRKSTGKNRATAPALCDFGS